MEDEQKQEKIKRLFGTQPKKKSGTGRMAQTSRAGTGDSVGWFRRYQ